MCGLFGVLGSGVIKEDLTIFVQLSITMMLRGKDSTGIAVGNSNSKKTPIVIKEPGEASYFWDTLNAKEISVFQNISNNFWIGHTRSATRGSLGKLGAQPFACENITGVHNGTLWGSHGTYNSDSHMLLDLISTIGVEASFNNFTEGDSFALVWYDHRDRKVHICRNRERELFFSYHPTRNVMYWCSEKYMLRAVLERNKLKESETPIYAFTEHNEYLFDPNALKNYKENGKPILRVHKREPIYTSWKSTMMSNGQMVPWEGTEDYWSGKHQGTGADL